MLLFRSFFGLSLVEHFPEIDSGDARSEKIIYSRVSLLAIYICPLLRVLVLFKSEELWASLSRSQDLALVVELLAGLSSTRSRWTDPRQQAMNALKIESSSLDSKLVERNTGML